MLYLNTYAAVSEQFGKGFMHTHYGTFNAIENNKAFSIIPQ